MRKNNKNRRRRSLLLLLLLSSQRLDALAHGRADDRDLMSSSLPLGIAAITALASPVLPRFWSFYTLLSDPFSSAAFFSRAVGAAAAGEVEEEDEEAEEEEAEAAGAAACTAESAMPPPASSRSRAVGMPLCMVPMPQGPTVG